MTKQKKWKIDKSKYVLSLINTIIYNLLVPIIIGYIINRDFLVIDMNTFYVVFIVFFILRIYKVLVNLPKYREVNSNE